MIKEYGKWNTLGLKKRTDLYSGVIQELKLISWLLLFRIQLGYYFFFFMNESGMEAFFYAGISTCSILLPYRAWKVKFLREPQCVQYASALLPFPYPSLADVSSCLEKKFTALFLLRTYTALLFILSLTFLASLPS